MANLIPKLGAAFRYRQQAVEAAGVKHFVVACDPARNEVITWSDWVTHPLGNGYTWLGTIPEFNATFRPA